MSGYRIVPEHHVMPAMHGPDGQPQPALVFNYAIRGSDGRLLFRAGSYREAEKIWHNLSPEGRRRVLA